MTKSKKKRASKKNSPSGFRYEIKQNPTHFSIREAQCASYFKDRSTTIEEVAKALNISTKTVEYYLNNVKMKLKCFDTKELIDVLKQLDLKHK